MHVEEVNRISVVGAGTMGAQIGLQCARYGYRVALYDVELVALQAAKHQQRRYLEGFISSGEMTAEEAEAALERVMFTTDPAEAAAEADLLSESVPEDPALKAKVFAQFNALCPPRTVFTSNASWLIPSMFASATGRPAQFPALHFHPPVWLANVVDIMPHPETSEETVALLEALALRLGQTPVVFKKESPGYIVNRMLGAMNREALRLAVDEISSPAEIDHAWMGVTKMGLGPFGIMDSVGLDTV
jgi:3-hydroxybutyryl-CoA dehydrogenase